MNPHWNFTKKLPTLCAKAGDSLCVAESLEQLAALMAG